MEAVITGAIAAIIGLVSGQAISVRLSGAKDKDASRIAALEQTVSTMITREEVQSAFLQVAKIEAEKQKAAMMPPPVPSNVSFEDAVLSRQQNLQKAAFQSDQMNQQMNQQLAALQSRLKEIQSGQS